MNQNNPPQPDTLEAEKPEAAATEQKAVQQPSEKAETRQETPDADISKENTKAGKQSIEPQPLADPAAAPVGKPQQRS
jgi:hypothetical protein